MNHLGGCPSCVQSSLVSCLCTNTMISCVLFLLFVNCECEKERKKEGLKLDKWYRLQ